MAERKVHDPLALAQEYTRLGMEGTTCPHGVDRFEPRGILLVTGAHWMCRCCTHRFMAPMPDGGLCYDCSYVDGVSPRCQEHNHGHCYKACACSCHPEPSPAVS